MVLDFSKSYIYAGTSGSSTTTGGTGSSTGTSTGTGASGSSTVSGPSTTRRTTRRTTTTTKKPTTTKPKPPPPYKATLNCRCGTQSVRGDLVGGGTIIRYNVNPWLVSISSGGKHLCSGSLINDRDILTSKACTKNAGGNITVTAGMTSRKPTNYTVTKISTNPKFNLALLRLSKPVKVGHTMRPVCIPIVKRKSEDYSTGMLVTFKKGPPPKNTTLQMIDTEVAIMDASSDKCNNTPAGGICAGPPGSVKCGGDTGGLLQVYRGGYSYEQIGVVAGTVGCRSSSTPGAYTDIRGRARWILNNAKGGNFCKNPKISSSDLSSTIRLGDLDLPFNDDEMEEEIVEDGDNDSIRHSGNLIEDAEDEDQGAEIFDDGEESRDDFS
ncbi:unnamed protein product [Orchesella dallaii]|uniref:Peptidase S1 domain-containing protein n=1 Tax=Orchesella dallaii TaxID=48710 RepID=A0ABP1R5S9_9HEXA